MGEVCSRFEKLSAWSAVFLNNDYASVQRCGMALPPASVTGPLPLQPLNIGFPSDLPVVARTMGVSEATPDQAACVDKAASWMDRLATRIPPGESQTKPATCETHDGKVLVRLDITKTCEPGQDAARPGSCTVTARPRPDAARP